MRKRTGSACDISVFKRELLVRTYTDFFSVFDRGRSTQAIVGLGESRAACAIKTFRLLEDTGLPTHFMQRFDRRSFVMQEFLIPGHAVLSGASVGRVLPVEWLWREPLTGSVYARTLLDPQDPYHITTEQLGLPAGTPLIKGMKLPKVFLNCTTKFEKIDRPLSDAEAQRLCELSDDQWNEAQQLLLAAAEVIKRAYYVVGIDCMDGKFELGVLYNGKIVIVDVAGTPDENRLEDSFSGESLCKDVLRFYFEGLPWKAELDEAKKLHPNDNSMWPPYPQMPADFVQKVARIYADVAWRYGEVRVEIS